MRRSELAIEILTCGVVIAMLIARMLYGNTYNFTLWDAWR